MNAPRFKPGSLCVVVESQGASDCPNFILSQVVGKIVKLDVTDSFEHDQWYWSMDPPLIVYNYVPGTHTTSGQVLALGPFIATVGERCLKLIKGPDVRVEDESLVAS